MKTTPLIILDNGHGNNTGGKRSPVWADGKQLFEFEFNRDIVQRIAKQLDHLGIAYEILVPEIHDIPLGERVRRANILHAGHNSQSLLISVHANAGGGTGWEVWTSKGKTKSDDYATIFFEEAEKEFSDKWRMRADYSDGDPDKEANFQILRDSKGSAILTENFFMDTEKDCRFIMSEEGRCRVTNMHVAAIRRIVGK